MTFSLVGHAGPRPASADPPPEPVAANWSDVGLDGLDQQIESIVNRPAPAELRDEAVLTLSSPTPTSPIDELGLEFAAPSADVDEEVFPELTGGVAPVNASDRQSVSPPMPAEPVTREPATREPHQATTVVVEAKSRTIPPEVAALQPKVERCLQIHAQQRLNSGKDSCWSMMHAFLGWGPNCEINVGGPRGPRSNAIAWVGQNKPCGGRRLFYLDGNRIRGREGPGYQGHPAQFLSMLAQCDVDTNFALRVNDRPLTVADLIEEEKRTCATGTELTFKLLGLVHYLGTEATWQTDEGETWDIPKLLALELAQPINGVACGGTHRIMAVTYAVAKRKKEGKSIDGHWWRADKYVSDYQRYAMTLQNRDGSFSSDWFRQRADWGDMERRVQTTGHILEWLVFSLPDEALYDPRIVRSVSYLSQTLTQNSRRTWPIGPKGHTIRALRLYHERVFQQADVHAPLARRHDASAKDR